MIIYLGAAAYVTTQYAYRKMLAADWLWLVF